MNDKYYALMVYVRRLKARIDANKDIISDIVDTAVEEMRPLHECEEDFIRFLRQDIEECKGKLNKLFGAIKKK